MKAIVCTRYGPPEVLQLQEVEKPVPLDNELLIKIHATSVTSSDTIVRGYRLPWWHPVGIMMGIMLGFRKPRKSILGMVLAGEVESIGKDVKRFKKEDKVFAATILSATKIRMGAYAQYTTLPEDWVIVPKPSNATYEEAAAILYGGWLAIYFLKRGNIQKGQKVLIYGASGSVGTSAVQLAKYYGANVTGICSTTNIELVKSLGADNVIDYKKEDFTKKGERYGLILDSVPMAHADRKKIKSECEKVLAPNGTYVSVDSGTPLPLIEDFNFLKKLFEEKKLKAVIDKTYPLEQMAEAHRYVDKGHKKGNVVINVKHNKE